MEKAVLRRHFRIYAVTFTCPHCGEFHDLELDQDLKEISMIPTYSGEDQFWNCIKCEKRIEFDGERSDFD